MAKKKTGQQRSIDRVASESRSWLSRKMVLVRKNKITTLKGWAVITFFVGAMTMLVWAVNLNIETSSKAGSDNVVEKKTGAKFVKGELLIRFKSDVSKENQDKVLGGQGVKVKDEITQIKVKRISVPEQVQDKVREALAHNPNVEFVENNYLAEGQLIANDPSYISQWYLSKIAAPQAWDISTGAETQIITVCDTGIDPTHPDLAAKLLPGYNFYDNNTNTADVQGHGTAVAGSAAAIGGNGTGIASVAWKNKILPVRIADPTAWATYSAMAQCINYGVDHGSRIINVSYGGTTSSATLQAAVDYAWSKNALVFASAGNNNTSALMYPAATNKVIGVTATDSADKKSSFSSFGDWVDLAAPGSNIYTTSRGGAYGSWNGTSFASPMTAGLASLILAVNPALTNTQVEAVLKNTADDLGVVGFDQYFGYGRINAQKALEYVNSGQVVAAPVDTVVPTINITQPIQNALITGKTFTIAAAAKDNIGVAKIEILLDNAVIKTCSAVTSCVQKLNVAKVAAGLHVIGAQAYDAAGNKGVATVVNVSK